MVKRKLSCPDFAFPLLSHDAVLDLIAAMGFEGVDIGLFEDRSHLRPSDQFDQPEKRAEQLRKRVEQRGLVVSDLFVQGDLDFHRFAPNHYEPLEREQSRKLFLQTLVYAKELGTKHITGLPGVFFPEEESEDISYRRCVEEQRFRVEKAGEAGLSYGVEAHIGSLIEEPKSAKRFLEEVKGLTLTLDYSHIVRLGFSDEEGDVLLPYTSHFHARGAAKGVLQTSLSDNEIDFAHILKKLDLMGYSDYFCTEYCFTPEWENCSRNDNVSEIMLMKNFLLSH